MELDGWQLVRCQDCRLVFTSPRYTESYLERLYAKRFYERASGYFAMQMSKPSDDDYDLANSLRQICRLGREGRRLRSLDVGCGGGRMVQAFQGSGWEGVGIDLSSKAVEAGIKGGLDLRVACVDDPRLGRFDLITAFHILEHVHSPRKFLNGCAERLQGNGHLLIEVPNYGSYRASRMGKYWPYLYPDGHLYQFTMDTLRGYFQEAKFEIIWLRKVHGKGPLEDYKPGPANKPHRLHTIRNGLFACRHLFYWSPPCRRIVRHLLWHSLGFGEFIRVLAQNRRS
jgi:2-polyprenyl-3-methyl-5-hydroxy-6-metoxy-1,4-benzoquinol methylase